MNIEKMKTAMKSIVATMLLVPLAAHAALVDVDGNPATNETYLADIDMSKGTLGDIKDAAAPGYSMTSNAAANAVSKSEIKAGFLAWEAFFTDGTATNTTYSSQDLHVEASYSEGQFAGWIPMAGETILGTATGAVDSVHLEWTYPAASIPVGTKVFADRCQVAPSKVSQLQNDANYTTVKKVTETAFKGYGWPFGDWSYTPIDLGLTLPVYTNSLWRFTETNDVGEVVGDPKWIESADGEDAVELTYNLNTTNVVFSRDGTPVYTNAHGLATVSNLTQYVKHTQLQKTLGGYVSNETLQNYDASYKMVEGISTENQTVQFVTSVAETYEPLNIAIPTSGQCKDWIVYVYPATNMYVVLPPATYWMKSDSVTNDITGGKLTALYFSQAHPDGVYVVGRQEYSTFFTVQQPLAVPASIQMMHKMVESSKSRTLTSKTASRLSTARPQLVAKPTAASSSTATNKTSNAKK